MFNPWPIRASSLPNAGAALALLVMLSSCNNSGKGEAPSITPTATVKPTVTPTPTPSAAPASYDVLPCFYQVVPGTGGTAVSGLIIPDVLTLDFNKPSTFPNGRQLIDPVVDITLAALFLDLTKHSPATLANIPINPPANDRPFRTDFPYLAAPQGNPPISGTSGTSFNFRTDPASAYVRVDREGMPAVTAALIGGSRKLAYNDANPSNDLAGDFVYDLAGQLELLTNGLADDFIAAGLTPCARKK